MPPSLGKEDAGGWDTDWRAIEGSSSAGSSCVPNQADLSKSTGGTAGAEAALCLWLNERHFPALSELFNSLKLLLLFSFNRNANMSAFLGGFIKYPAHHSEPHNSCQVPTSPSRVHCRV